MTGDDAALPRWGRWALPAGVAGLGAGPALLLWSGLPDEVAVHWDGGGDPNGHAGRWLGIGGPAVVAVALAVALAVELRRVRPRPVAAMLLGAFGSLAAVVSATTAIANRDITTWQEGSLPILGLLAQALGAVVGGGAAVLVLKDRWAMPQRRSLADAAPRRPGARAAWSGTASSRWGIAAVAAGAVLGALTVVALLVVDVVAVGIVLGIVLALVDVIVFASIASVRVTVGSHGLTARSPIGWPAVTIPLASIEAVESATLEPMQWGGWGYRGSLRMLGRAAWIVRRGDGVVLHLTDGHQFAVTVDDAADAAATLAGHLPGPGPEADPAGAGGGRRRSGGQLRAR